MRASEAALWTQAQAAQRSADFSGMAPQVVLRAAIEDFFSGRIALVSSFGAESAILLHMASQIDKDLPVLFIDTQVLFPETLAYRDELVTHFDLRNVIAVTPDERQVLAEDPENFMWSSDPDRCCEIRKVLPLGKALDAFDAWITGRKRFQAQTRADLAVFEMDENRVKINPLANWTARDLMEYISTNSLPHHPLVAKGYPSIGCIPCTSPVRPGEDSRAGRWRGKGKLECGLHAPTQGVEALK